jgi:hypothetical protein
LWLDEKKSSHLPGTSKVHNMKILLLSMPPFRHALTPMLGMLRSKNDYYELSLAAE